MSPKTETPTANLLTMKEAAEYLNTSPATIKRWRSERRIPAVKLSRQVRFRREDLDSFIEECYEPADL